MKTHYAVLGVAQTVSADALRQAYRTKARETHPDHGGDPQRFATVRHAWEVLKDADQRAAYDRALLAQMQADGQVLCPACGEANTVPPDTDCGCHACDVDLPRRPRTARDAVDEVTDRFRQRAVRLSDQAAQGLAQAGERLVVGVGDLLLDGVESGLGALRRKLGLRPRGGRS